MGDRDIIGAVLQGRPLVKTWSAAASPNADFWHKVVSLQEEKLTLSIGSG
jgi:hypothetical protein